MRSILLVAPEWAKLRPNRTSLSTLSAIIALVNALFSKTLSWLHCRLSVCEILHTAPPLLSHNNCRFGWAFVCYLGEAQNDTPDNGKHWITGYTYDSACYTRIVISRATVCVYDLRLVYFTACGNRFMLEQLLLLFGLYCVRSRRTTYGELR